MGPPANPSGGRGVRVHGGRLAAAAAGGVVSAGRRLGLGAGRGWLPWRRRESTAGAGSDPLRRRCLAAPCCSSGRRGPTRCPVALRERTLRGFRQVVRAERCRPPPPPTLARPAEGRQLPPVRVTARAGVGPGAQRPAGSEQQERTPRCPSARLCASPTTCAFVRPPDTRHGIEVHSVKPTPLKAPVLLPSSAVSSRRTCVLPSKETVGFA